MLVSGLINRILSGESRPFARRQAVGSCFFGRGELILKEKELLKKLSVFSIVIVIIFIVLGFRLFYLQVVRADTFEDLADKNKFRIVSITARRGDIYDREKTVLATSKPVFSVTLTSSEIVQKENVAEKLAEISRSKMAETSCSPKNSVIQQ
jgi:cell division protein FtsI/penicillin-binding protein 2